MAQNAISENRPQDDVVVDAAFRDAAQGTQAMVMRIEQHLLRLQRIGSEHERPRVAELEVRQLQLHLAWTDSRPVLAPVELEGLTRGENQGHKGSTPGTVGFLAFSLPPVTSKGGDPVTYEPA